MAPFVSIQIYNIKICITVKYFHSTVSSNQIKTLIIIVIWLFFSDLVEFALACERSGDPAVTVFPVSSQTVKTDLVLTWGWVVLVEVQLIHQSSFTIAHSP